MAAETNAGSIFVELKTQVEGLKRGVTESKQMLAGFGRSVEQVAASINRGGVAMSQSFEEMDRRSVRLAARMALLTNRLLSLQLVIQNFGTRFQSSKFSREISIVSDALSSFGSIVSVFPNKIGVAVGILAALGTVIANLTGPTQAQRKEIEKITSALEDLEKQRAALEGLGERRQEDRRTRDRLLDLDLPRDRVEKEERDLEATLAERERLIAKIVNLQQEIDLRGENGRIAGSRPGQILTLGDELSATKDALDKINKAAKDQTFAKSMREARQEVADLNRETQTAQASLELFFRHGLLDPTSMAKAQSALSEKRLASLMEVQARMEREKPGSGAELSTSIAAEIESVKQARTQLARTQEVDRMAENFSGAIGQGIVNGILQGESAMEVLADVGKNLMSNALQDAVKIFQDGMTSAFKAITGVAGVELGGLITGIVGVAGALLSRRGSKGQDTFASIKSNIESSQAVRGIVAGPANVAIASVGESIERAFAPALEVLRHQLEVLRQIARGTGAGGGAGYAGRVATT